jgi:putative peptidoglycan lipid II flippase
MTDNTSESQALLSSEESETVSEKRKMTRAAGVVGFWTFLSRVLGFVRDVIIALFMGAGLGADAFFVAFRIPNLLRRLFAEGALSAAFIPTFVETLEKEGKAEAARLACIAFTFASILLAVVTVIGITCSPWIVRVFAPGFFDIPEKFSLTVHLNQIMFPYIFFISLVALAAGVLNSMGHFAAPAAAPVVLNLCMISSVALLSYASGMEPYFALAWGVLLAGVLQLALQIPFLIRVGVRLRPNFDFGHPAMRRIGVLFIPAAFAGAVYQINVMIGTILASLLPPGSVSWLYYADRLVELPLGVFAITLGVAVLPSMSRQAGNGDMDALKQSVSFALRLIAFFTIPASVGLIILRVPIVAVLFQRGLFTEADTQQTAYALLLYTVGLWAFSGLKVITQAFFSLKDTKTPLYVAIGAVLVNLVVGIILMGPLKHGGLALATAIAAAFNFLTLFIILHLRLNGPPLNEMIASIGKISAASLFMGAVIWYGGTLADWSHGLTLHSFLVLFGSIAAGTIAFALAGYLFRCTELKFIAKMVRRST